MRGERFRASGQKRPHRQQEDLVEVGQRSVRLPLSWTVHSRGCLVPFGDEGFERVAFTGEREDPLILVGLERFKSAEDIRRLPERQPEIAPLEWNVAEPDDRPPGALLRRQPSGFGLDPRQRHARLNASLHFDEGKLHVDRRRKVGLRNAQLLELGDFSGVGALRTDRTIGHRQIVSRQRGRP